jgi:prevent-host-death family protein
MQVVKIADLKNNLSRHLTRVRRGGTLTVLDRNAPIARIVPIDHHPASGAEAADERLAELVSQGILTPGSQQALARWVDAHPPIKRPGKSRSAVQTLIDMRRESTR